MENLYNGEKVVIVLVTQRKLNTTDSATNMLANCMIGRDKTSGLEPDLYTITLTEKTFYADYSRKSLHGDMPKKITKLNIPNEDIVLSKIVEKGSEKTLKIVSDWGKEYYFTLDSDEKVSQANKIVEFFNKEV